MALGKRTRKQYLLVTSSTRRSFFVRTPCVALIYVHYVHTHTHTHPRAYTDGHTNSWTYRIPENYYSVGGCHRCCQKSTCLPSRLKEAFVGPFAFDVRGTQRDIIGLYRAMSTESFIIRTNKNFTSNFVLYETFSPFHSP